MIAPISIPPGVAKNGTEYQNAGRWYDANLVRWFEGTLRPVGGWVKLLSSQQDGPVRAALSWRQNDYLPRLAVATPSKLYVYATGSIYDITPAGLTAGRSDSFAGYGFGYGDFGEGDYGESQWQTAPLQATTWSLDTWGENLVACSTTDGKLYVWENAVLTDATQITNSPENCLGLIVTPERHLVALGADGDNTQIAWSTAEDNTVWTPTSTNSAGSIRLQTTSRIMLAKRVRSVTLILTETDLHAMTYIGQPFIYRTEKIGGFCGAISPNSAEVVEGGLIWMGHSSFYAFDGAVRAIPCDVSDYVFSDLNRSQAVKITTGHNSRFGELWWFYPSAESTENDRYVVWNYRENHWSVGQLARTCWVDAGVYDNPIAGDPDGYLYEHENGWTADGTPIEGDRYAHSGPVEIGAGAAIMHAKQILPDEKTHGSVQFSMRSRFTPNGSETSHGPFTVDHYTDCRVTGRQIALDVEGTADEDWRLGRVRLDASPGGAR